MKTILSCHVREENMHDDIIIKKWLLKYNRKCQHCQAFEALLFISIPSVPLGRIFNACCWPLCLHKNIPIWVNNDPKLYFATQFSDRMHSQAIKTFQICVFYFPGVESKSSFFFQYSKFHHVLQECRGHFKKIMPQQIALFRLVQTWNLLAFLISILAHMRQKW
jgi:hypothetical protein